MTNMNIKKSLKTLSLLMLISSASAYADVSSEKLAQFIQSHTDMCTCRSSTEQIVHCNIELPMGTDILTAISGVEKVANTFAQVGRLGSTVFYTGYVGSQKVCKYKYDMYDGSVTREF